MSLKEKNTATKKPEKVKPTVRDSFFKIRKNYIWRFFKDRTNFYGMKQGVLTPCNIIKDDFAYGN